LKGVSTKLKDYKHLNLEEREKIYALKEKGLSLRDIARKLNRNVSTISRELRRPKYGRKYIPCVVQREADRIAKRQRSRARLKNIKVFLYVRKHLREDGWSPETIAGRLPLDHPGESICHETIYRYIYLNPKTKREKPWKYLKLHRKKRMKVNGRKVKGYTKLSEAVPVPERPEDINNRSELGHWETDNMEGKKSDRSSISVSVERVTRKVKLGKLKDHTAKTKTNTVIDQLSDKNKGFVRSITMDRGPEDSGYLKIAKSLGVDIYGCTPYHSWEKGSVENTIQRLRRYIPKGESIDNITQTYLTLLEDKFNNTPRKCLGFLTPNEYYERIRSAPFT
jgi:IS30 family transposase